jgi:hypothetical protein
MGPEFFAQCVAGSSSRVELLDLIDYSGAEYSVDAAAKLNFKTQTLTKEKAWQALAERHQVRHGKGWARGPSGLWMSETAHECDLCSLCNLCIRSHVRLEGLRRILIFLPVDLFDRALSGSRCSM